MFFYVNIGWYRERSLKEYTMQVQRVNTGNAPSFSKPAFGSLIIKNKDLFVKYGRDIVEHLENNKSISEFARRRDYDLVLSASERPYADGIAFKFAIKSKKSLMDRLFKNSNLRFKMFAARDGLVNWGPEIGMKDFEEYIQKHFPDKDKVAKIDAKINQLQDFKEQKKVKEELKKLEKGEN